MALTDLLDALESDIEAEARGRVARAEQEAARIRTELDRKVREARRAAVAEREAGLRARATAKLAEARRRARAEVLAAREGLLERLRAALAERRSGALESSIYLDALERHLEEALAFLGEGPGRVRCSPSLTARLEDLLADRAGVQVQADQDVSDGLVVVSQDGSVTIENTLSARTERLWPRLAIAALRELGMTDPWSPGTT